MRPMTATLIPLSSALGYTFAALMLKRATERGVGPWRVMVLVNWTVALLFLPWWLKGGNAFEWTHCFHAIISGATFFVGQILTFLALSRGDVSITTPVLGTKVILVAFFAALFAGENLTPSLWLAAFLTTVATALLGGEIRTNRERVLPSLMFGLSAATAYASADIQQLKWAPAWGFGHYAPVMFITVGCLALCAVPLLPEPLSSMPRRSAIWAMGGGTILALQATGIAYSIAEFREVTLTNIIYNTRGVWSVLLVWAAGHWFSNTERSVGNAIMGRRLLGASLLLIAVLIGLKRP